MLAAISAKPRSLGPWHALAPPTRTWTSLLASRSRRSRRGSRKDALAAIFTLRDGIGKGALDPAPVNDAPPGMGMVRGYLVISVILLIVKAIEVGTGGH